MGVVVFVECAAMVHYIVASTEQVGYLYRIFREAVQGGAYLADSLLYGSPLIQPRGGECGFVLCALNKNVNQAVNIYQAILDNR